MHAIHAPTSLNTHKIHLPLVKIQGPTYPYCKQKAVDGRVCNQFEKLLPFFLLQLIY